MVGNTCVIKLDMIGRNLTWTHVLCCALMPAVALAQDKPSATAAPELPFASQIKKAVVFIQTDCRTAKGIEPKIGTGFLLFVPEPRIGADRGFQYLVTNRHVAQPGIEDSKPCEVAGYHIRLNLKAPAKDQPASVLVPLGGDSAWFFPTDDSVDLAAMPIKVDDKLCDFVAVPFNMLSDQTGDALREGDEVLFTGLFIQYMGQSRMQPIVRSGTVAMLPDEPFPTTLKKPGHVYLTEVHAFGGNSGSPMFVDVAGPRRGKFGYDFKLLGVVAGEVFETSDFHLQIVTSLNGEVSANSGISVVVPASDIKALLTRPDLQKLRDDTVAREKSEPKK